jgi:hypothetical protein
LVNSPGRIATIRLSQKIKTRRFELLIALLLFFQTTRAGDKFDGERLTYRLSTGVIGKAEALLTSAIFHSDSVPKLEIELVITTDHLTGLLFRVKNRYFSQVDLRTWLTERTSKTIDQSNIRQDFTTFFSREDNFARTSDGKNWPILNGSMDILCMLYKLRDMNLLERDTLNLILDIESHPIVARGIVTYADPVSGPYEELPVSRVDLCMEKGGRSREWKTDLLNNRLSLEGAQLEVFLGPEPQRLPLLIRFGRKKNMVTMRLIENH